MLRITRRLYSVASHLLTRQGLSGEGATGICMIQEINSVFHDTYVIICDHPMSRVHACAPAMMPWKSYSSHIHEGHNNRKGTYYCGWNGKLSGTEKDDFARTRTTLRA